ncbi:MAG: hypothetical protein CSA66_01970 [Proteobacteria bacterium]|nr:MAG: hypothetical protein CSA66_01970 [Pseudomonadota bacterium]
MPNEGDSQSGGLSKIIVTVVMLAAAFLILRFVIGAAMAILKWVFLAAAVVFIAWLFLRDSGKGSSSG